MMKMTTEFMKIQIHFNISQISQRQNLTVGLALALALPHHHNFYAEIQRCYHNTLFYDKVTIKLELCFQLL